MEIELDNDGHPACAVIVQLSGKNVALPPSKSGVHLFQALGARWRSITDSLAGIADELDALIYGIDPDGDPILKAFKQLIYDATELFDVYGQLIPEIVRDKVSKVDLKDYKQAAKRLRDRWALICNKCKHDGSQIVFSWATSELNGACSPRYMVCSYKGGDSLVRDEEVHRGQANGVCIRRSVNEIIHALLRLDVLAARLLSKCAEDTSTPLPIVSGAIKIGDSIKGIIGHPTRSYPAEPSKYDGLEIDGSKLRLCRGSTQRLIGSIRSSVTLMTDGVTRTYSFM